MVVKWGGGKMGWWESGVVVCTIPAIWQTRSRYGQLKKKTSNGVTSFLGWICMFKTQ